MTTSTVNRNRIGEIRELTGEELDLVSGGGGAAVLGALAGAVVGTLIVATSTVVGVAKTVTGQC